MSTALAETVDSLHIRAAQKLLELLDTVTDPKILARLVATALRFKLPSPARTPAARPPSDNARNTPDAPPPPFRPYSQDEYADLIRRHGSAEAMEMRSRRDALVANYHDLTREAAPPS